MAFDLDGARKEGYSDQEIAGFLGAQSGFDVAAATKEGYSPSEIIGFLSAQEKPQGLFDSVKSGAGKLKDAAVDAVSSIGKPYKSVLEDTVEVPTNDAQKNREAMQKSVSPESVMYSSGRGLAKAERVIEGGKRRQEKLKTAGFDSEQELRDSIEASDRRAKFAEDNPLTASLASGIASQTAGVLNSPQVASEFFNKTFVDPVLNAVGAKPMPGAPKTPGTDSLMRMAADYMPAVGKKDFEDVVGTDQFMPWMLSNMAQNSPQAVMSVTAALFPPLRAAILPSMGAGTSGQQWLQGDDPRVALAKGAIEVGTEMLPLGVFDKIKDTLMALPRGAQRSFLSDVGKRVLAGTAGLVGQHLTEGSEEWISQVGQNALDRYVQGKNVALDKGAAGAYVVGAGMGGAMGAPHLVTALQDNSPQARIERELAGNLNEGQFAPVTVGPQTNPNLTTDPVERIMSAGSVSDAIRFAQEGLARPGQVAAEAGQRWQDIAPSIPGEDLAAQREAAMQQRASEEAGAAASRATDQRIADVGQQWQDLGISQPSEDLQRQRVGLQGQNASNPVGDGTDVPTGIPAGSADLAGGESAGGLGDSGPGAADVATGGSGTAVPVDAGGERSLAVGRFQAPITPQTEPASTWFGRRGDGYLTPGDAQMAIPSRQRVAPELTWTVEQMPSGKFRLAGYAPVTVKNTGEGNVGQVSQQASVQQERGSGNEGGQETEAGGGNRVLSAEPAADRTSAAPAQEVAPSVRPVEESDQDRSHREWRENYDRVVSSSDLSKISTKDLERASNYAANRLQSEKRKGWTGGPVNQSFVDSVQREQDFIDAEVKRRREPAAPTERERLAAMQEAAKQRRGSAASGGAERQVADTLRAVVGPQVTTQKRAASGGEYGPNGEWYKGGAFIATTDLPKKTKEWIKRANKGGQAIIDFGNVKADKRVGEFPIIRPIANLITREGNLNTRYAEYLLEQGAKQEYVDRLRELVDKFKQGERFAKVTEYPDFADSEDLVRMLVNGQPIPGAALSKFPDHIRENLKALSPAPEQPPASGKTGNGSESAMAAMQQQRQGALLPEPLQAVPERYGRDGKALSEGGKPFKSKLMAQQFRREHSPQSKVVSVEGGYALRDQTDKEIAAGKDAGKRRLASARAASYEKNPLLAFLADHGIFYEKGNRRSVKSDLSPDKNPLIAGYGLIFRRTGEQIDTLAAIAAEDGFLPPGTEDEGQFVELIARALRGERIAPMYAQGEAEREMARTAPSYDEMAGEDIAPSLFDVTTDDLGPEYQRAAPEIQAEVNALLALAEAQGLDTEAIKEDAARSTSDQSEDAYYAAAKQALETALAGSGANRSASTGTPGRAAGQAASQEELDTANADLADLREQRKAARGQKRAALDARIARLEDAISDSVLVSPTPADILAQQERAAQAEREQKAADKAAADKAKAEREQKEIAARQNASAENFQLGQDAEDSLSGQAPMFARAYHGSPHKFDAFKLDRIGSGEGAQAFGWGLYFAGKKEVADFYRKKLSEENPSQPTVAFEFAGNRYSNMSAEGHALNLLKNGGKREALVTARQMLADAKAGKPYTQEQGRNEAHYQKLHDFVQAFDSRDTGKIKAIKDSGQLYEVEIPDDDVMLDFNKDWAGQPKPVKDALKAAGVDKRYRANLSDFASPMATRNQHMRGENIYAFLAHELGGEKEASLYLDSIGILGLKYKGGTIAGVRNAGANYVLFNDSRVSIERAMYRRGESVSTGLPVPEIRAALAPAIASLKVPFALHPNVEALRIATGYRAIPIGVKGAYFKGKLHLVADGITSELDAEETFFHEVLHAGLDRMYGTGSKAYEGALRDLSMKNGNIREAAREWMRKYGAEDTAARIADGMSPERAERRTKLQALDEALAELSGRNAQINGLAKFIAKVQEFMRSIGLVRLANALEGRTDAEALSMILGAREAVTGTERGQGVGGMVPSWLRVFHGSPHEIGPEGFKTDKIGTGEGAQAYGWGLYFAGRKEVAEYYRQSLSQWIIKTSRGTMTGGELADTIAWMADNKVKSLDSAIRSQANKVATAIASEGKDYKQQVDLMRASPYARMYAGVADAVERLAPERGKGRLYEVEIPEEGEYLLWDEPLSKQPEQVRKALATALAKFSPYILEKQQVAIDKLALQIRDGDITGERLYRDLSSLIGKSDEITSKLLHSLGIAGIKYLDGTSRSKGEGSYNYVVFSDDAVKIEASYSRKDDNPPMASRKDVVGTNEGGRSADDNTKGDREVWANSLPRAGREVDGRTVRDHIPNQSSIHASISNPEILSGVRVVPLSAFDYQPGKPDQRTLNLAEQIKESGEINPLIVGIDAKGPYVIEGGHRLDALIHLGAKELPAQIIIDLDEFPNESPAPNSDGAPSFSRSVVTGQNMPQTWQAPDETKLDNLIYALQDKHIDTKRAVQAVRDAIGAIADEQDPYLQEELFHSRASSRVKEFLDKELRPLLIDIQARGIDISDFEEYLHNRHAERRNVQVAKVNPGMPDGGSGIKTADARAYLANLPVGKKRAFEALAKRVDAITKDTRDLLVSSGLEKRSTIDAWDAAYGAEYVPLMREEMDDGRTGLGQGYSVRGSASKRALGSDKPVADIIANIAMQRERTIVRAQKRRVGEALYGLVLKAPNDDFWFAVDPQLQSNPQQVISTQMQLIAMGLDPMDALSIAQEPKTRYLDQNTGQMAERINPALRSAENVLAVRIDGEDKFIFFNAKDERAMRMVTALKNLDADHLGTAMGYVAKMTRWFASVNTQYNPIFGVTNITRDVQTALLNLNSTPLKDHKTEVMKHILPALRGIYIDLRDHRAGKTPTSAYAQLFEEFQKEGGATGYRDMYANAAERADAIVSELKAIKSGKAMKITRGIFDWLSDYNEAMENAVRVAAYKVGVEQGLSKQQAASLAKNISVNFNRKGQIALQTGALYAFFNASAQGSARMAQTMFEGGKLSSVGKKIIAGGLLLGSMQALLLAAAGFDDDEPPQFVRERALVLPIGGNKYLSIPMPLGFHVIPNLGRIPTEWAMSGFKKTPQRIGQMLGLFLDAFNPIGSGTVMQTLAPTIMDPLAALAENKDWTGKPIAKKDFNSLTPTAGHTRAKDTATPWAKMISYGVNIATGGTDYKPGLASPTPDQIDYLIGQVTGGVGREVGKLAQVGGGAMSGEEVPLYKIPLVGRFVGTTEGQAAEASRFYNNLRQLGEHKAEIDGLRKDHKGKELSTYLRENREAQLVPMADKIQRDVSKMQQIKRDLIKKDASRERVKLIDMQITARMKVLNDRVRATSGTSARTGQ